MTVRCLDPVADAVALSRLIEQYPFYPHRNYRLFSRRRQGAVLRAEIDRALEPAGDRLATIEVDVAQPAAGGSEAEAHVGAEEGPRSA